MIRRRTSASDVISTRTFRNCSFCGSPIPAGTGLMHVRNDGRILWTCSDKCKKNLFVLRRDARKLKWTERYVKGGAQVKKK
ncbi:LSU ribosomal protein L24E [Candidatus Nitrososphaera evergladensis SR1]|uniref:Large ribosomal subunit protein eL24 n=1 Tax=Candidatus Nitrososphaera evergladensis SR1 TaxID=1459636 RepID=A0A075MRE0_9ARCH|nr:50S ribosomal protein L24e [Candidatus Nitrososphaera evergladensis]AIF83660.1 LSU ribosomal protein L24E [Candidatus Nitrososphaera evergladensis SR1]